MVARLVAFALSLILVGQGLTLHHSAAFALAAQGSGFLQNDSHPQHAPQTRTDDARATYAAPAISLTVQSVSELLDIEALTPGEIYADQSIDSLEESSPRHASKVREPPGGAPFPNASPTSRPGSPDELLRPPRTPAAIPA